MPDLLFLAQRLPYPANRPETLRCYHLLKFLSQRYRVHFGCFLEQHSDLAHLGRIRALCYETCFVERDAVAARLRSLRALSASEAFGLAYYRDRKLSAWVERVQHHLPIEAALASGAPMAQYLMPASGMRRVADFAEVGSDRSRRRAEALGGPAAALWRREARTMLAYETMVMRQFDHITVPSHTGAALLRRLVPGADRTLELVPNGVDADYFSPHILHRDPYPTACRALVFAGAADDGQHADALDCFVREVFVALYAADHALRLYVVGAAPCAQFIALARRHSGVVVVGAVADVRPYLAHAAVAVAPVPVPFGSENCMLEAMAMQKVVVACPQALDAIPALCGEEVLTADDAGAFIHHIRSVLTDHAARAVALMARARVLRNCSWANSLAALDQLLRPISVAGLGDARRQAWHG